MKSIRSILLICLLLVLLAGCTATVSATDTANSHQHPIMHPNQTTLQRWIGQYEAAEPMQIDPVIRNRAIQSTGAQSLLSHLPYTPEERNQNPIGNCWVWAGTGVLEVAHDINNQVFDRLSIQYLDSNYNGGSGSDWAGEGGSLTEFVQFYNEKRIAVPWSNTNADFQDGREWCSTNMQAWVQASSIQTTPHYDITTITEKRIETRDVNQVGAIADIKAVLDQDQAIYLGFRLPDEAAWNDFYTFWDTEGEDAVWDPSQYMGRTWNSNTGGGHAVLCVGYDDTDPNNRYWILVNSWGTADGKRPHGIFRMKMDIDYTGTYQAWYDVPVTEWETASVTYGGTTPTTTTPTRTTTIPTTTATTVITTTPPTTRTTTIPTTTATTVITTTPPTTRTTTIPTTTVTQTPTPTTPSFAGTWETTFGQMDLTVVNGHVYGTYGYWGGWTGTIDGTLYGSGQTLYGTWSDSLGYNPPGGSGPFSFTLTDDGSAFEGQFFSDDWMYSGWWNGLRSAVPATVDFFPATTSVNSGEAASFNLDLSTVTDGIWAYTVRVSSDDPSVATITAAEPPQWAWMTSVSSLPASTVTIRGSDLFDQIWGRMENVQLGHLTIQGKAAGTARLTVTVTRLNDDEGSPISVTTEPAVITVESPAAPEVIAIPPQTSRPTDPDQDGRYEDLNGNGMLDFSDVALFFNQMDWIGANEPVNAFDFNGNGQIDFNDVVILFGMI